MTAGDLYPYAATLGVLIVLARDLLRGKDWRETAEALKVRLDTLQGEVDDLKAHAQLDQKTIATLRRERTRDKATIAKLRQAVRQLVAALQAANIPIPTLVVLDEAVEDPTP